MIILIAGATHTGKTVLAQKILEKYKYPYLSVDHLKMGLIRSGQTELTPNDDKELVPYLWSITKEIVKTAVENHQNLVIEGCYIPFEWEKDFSAEYLSEIKYCCLIMTEKYIRNHFGDIKEYANVIEDRLDDNDLSMKSIIADNAENLLMCKRYGCNYILIENSYNIDPDFYKLHLC